MEKLIRNQNTNQYQDQASDIVPTDIILSKSALPYSLYYMATRREVGG